MKSIFDWLAEMEAEAMAQAPARGHAVLVSGRTRIDCTYQPKIGRLKWYVDNRIADRELAAKALKNARQYTRFADCPEKG